MNSLTLEIFVLESSTGQRYLVHLQPLIVICQIYVCFAWIQAFTKANKHVLNFHSFFLQDQRGKAVWM